MIIFVLIIIRLIIPHIRQDKTYDFSEFQDEINEFEKSISETNERPEEGTTAPNDYPLFSFNPNTATREELLKLGLEQRVVRNILKYRDHGGRFRTREDLKKIYRLDSATYLRIEPFILISNQTGIVGEKSGDIKVQSQDTKVQSGDSVKLHPDSGVDRTRTVIPIPLNVSDSAALVNIYGIGPVLSVRIIKYRNLLGGYVSKDQLLEVYGMTSEYFENICNAIYIDTAAVTPIHINTANFAVLSRHPYLNDYQSRAIIAYREIKGKFNNTDEIEENGLLPHEIYMKLKPYLTVE